MIYLKRYNTENGDVLAVCDEELLGKNLKEGKLELDLNKYSNFYKGELLKEDKAKDLIKKVEIVSANIVGDRSVKIFLEVGLANESDIKTVQGIRFIHLYRVL